MTCNENGEAYPMCGAARWVSFAAAPTFMVMAVLTSISDGGPPDMLCSAAHGLSHLGGMVPMYLLMSAFHSAPWLKLVAGRSGGQRSSQIGSYRKR
jgi:hypothetical protein